MSNLGYTDDPERDRYPGIQNLRTAAFLTALTKVTTSYLEMGIFP